MMNLGRFGGYGYQMMGNGNGLRWIMMGCVFLFIVASLVVIFLLIRRSRCCGHNHMNTMNPIGTSALNILNDRYAKGEVSEEEYKRIKADLTS